MQRSLKMWLHDIQNACSKIQEYQKNTTFEQLNNNQMMQDAIIFNLQIIGEACKQIPADFRDENTIVEIPLD